MYNTLIKKIQTSYKDLLIANTSFIPLCYDSNRNEFVGFNNGEQMELNFTTISNAGSASAVPIHEVYFRAGDTVTSISAAAGSPFRVSIFDPKTEKYVKVRVNAKGDIAVAEMKDHFKDLKDIYVSFKGSKWEKLPSTGVYHFNESSTDSYSDYRYRFAYSGILTDLNNNNELDSSNNNTPFLNKKFE